MVGRGCDGWSRLRWFGRGCDGSVLVVMMCYDCWVEVLVVC